MTKFDWAKKAISDIQLAHCYLDQRPEDTLEAIKNLKFALKDIIGILENGESFGEASEKRA